MEQPIENYSKLRLTDLKTALESNNFDVYLAENKQEACKTVIEDIMPKLNARTISWGGSMTFIATGLYDQLKANPDLAVLDTLDKKIPADEYRNQRRHRNRSAGKPGHDRQSHLWADLRPQMGHLAGRSQ